MRRHEGAAAALAEDRNPHPLKGIVALIVEDDRDSREMMCTFLRELGATCVDAASGDQAFRLFREGRPDIIISDLWMPDGDGFELIRRVRALPPEEGGLIPAIAVSAASNTEEALLAGFHLLIAKPCDPQHLVDAVEEFLHGADQAPSLQVPWTVSSPEAGVVHLTFVGFVRVSDMRACADVLSRHLERQPCDLVVDFRGLTGFSLAAGSAAERAVWPHRSAIRSVHIKGGPRSARLVAAGSCRMLGLRYSIEKG